MDTLAAINGSFDQQQSLPIQDYKALLFEVAKLAKKLQERVEESKQQTVPKEGKFAGLLSRFPAVLDERKGGPQDDPLMKHFSAGQPDTGSEGNKRYPTDTPSSSAVNPWLESSVHPTPPLSPSANVEGFAKPDDDGFTRHPDSDELDDGPGDNGHDRDD